MTFTDEQTSTIIHAELDCSVSHGTMRAQDLIPTFLEVIKDTAEYAQLSTLAFTFPPNYALENETSDWWNTEDCSWFLNEQLFDILNNYAPDGYYFGSHPGDGSDYGYWKAEEV